MRTHRHEGSRWARMHADDGWHQQNKKMSEFNPDYNSCSYTHVWLRVMHEQLDLEEVTALLGVSPTSSIIAGELKSEKYDRRYKYTGWFLESAKEVESRDSRHHFAWLLNHMASKGNALKELLARGYLVDICCRWDSAAGHGGPTMDPEQMIQLGGLGIEVWFDIYLDGEEA